MSESASEPNRQSRPRPFVKWAGGKTQLLKEIHDRLPPEILESGHLQTYVEPFAGSGAVFFHLMHQFRVEQAVLVDINRELMVAYRVVKRDVDDLLERLQSLEEEYRERSETKRENFYYRMRDEYNRRMREFSYDEYNRDWVRRASVFLFLNRTCFNGLFRQNQSGEFNVPHGDYANPTICSTSRLTTAHRVLQDVKLIRGPFTDAAPFIGRDAFVYFDPPYLPLSETSSFTRYSREDFGLQDQKHLARFFRDMNRRGAYLMLSNSDPRNEDPEEDFFDDLYRGFEIERVSARRSINSKAQQRGEVKELLITNYHPKI